MSRESENSDVGRVDEMLKVWMPEGKIEGPLVAMSSPRVSEPSMLKLWSGEVEYVVLTSRG